jgi:uncharacterized membrane protein YgdD (TMEM256/DUF423 family)
VNRLNSEPTALLGQIAVIGLGIGLMAAGVSNIRRDADWSGWLALVLGIALFTGTILFARSKKRRRKV